MQELVVKFADGGPKKRQPGSGLYIFVVILSSLHRHYPHPHHDEHAY